MNLDVERFIYEEYSKICNGDFMKTKNKGYYSGYMDHETNSNKYTKIYINQHYSHIPNLDIGEYSYGHPTICWFGEISSLKIGKFCSIARNVQIWLGGEHDHSFVTNYPFVCYDFEWKHNVIETCHRSSKGNVIIGNDVWIGANVTILSGVTVGDGAVLGMNSLITKDVAPYSIVGGNPAKFIKNRFQKEDVDKLLAMKWWDLPKEKIEKAIPFLYQSNLSDFFNWYNENILTSKYDADGCKDSS